MDLLREIMHNVTPTFARPVPASPSIPIPPSIPTGFASPSPSSTSQTTPVIIPFLDISSPPTSILPPTPPTSLVSPLPKAGLMLSTPSTSSLPDYIPFHLSPSSTTSTPFIDLTDTYSPPIPPIDISASTLQANLSRHPFIGILPGASTEIFLIPQPLHFIPPSSTSIYTPVILSPLSHAPSISPIATLPPPPSFLPPSPSSLPSPMSHTFTLRKTSSSLSTAAPTFSLHDPTPSIFPPPSTSAP